GKFETRLQITPETRRYGHGLGQLEFDRDRDLD
ncbi:MAG: hypothetical protein US83_C0008G0067, partial [Candidatus Falkowbacteria bacterium GW2011_GWC2_38_22]